MTTEARGVLAVSAAGGAGVGLAVALAIAARRPPYHPAPTAAELALAAMLGAVIVAACWRIVRRRRLPTRIARRIAPRAGGLIVSMLALGAGLAVVGTRRLTPQLAYDHPSELWREWVRYDGDGWSRAMLLPRGGRIRLGAPPADGGWFTARVGLPRATDQGAELVVGPAPTRPIARIELRADARAPREVRLPLSGAPGDLALWALGPAPWVSVEALALGRPRAVDRRRPADPPLALTAASVAGAWAKVTAGGETRNAVIQPLGVERCVETTGRADPVALAVAIADGLETGIVATARLVRAGGATVATRSVRIDRTGWIPVRLDGPIAAADRLCLAATGDASPDWSVAWSEPLGYGASDTPDVVLISLDTVRADALGSYGRVDAATPASDELARRGVVFERADAPAAWTRPSHASLFTGLLPSRHGAWGASAAHGQLRRDVPTMATILRSAGYATFAATGGLNLDPVFGFDRGFDRYVVATPPPGGSDVDQVWSAVRGFLAVPGPRFLFVHSYAAHAPYGRPPYPHPGTYQYDAARSKTTYLAGVDHADELVARLLPHLAPETVVILVSDHGEEFAEHDPGVTYDGHGHSVHREVLHVPLIVAGAGARPGHRVATPVSLVDVLPTLLDLLSLPPAPGDGVSLADALHGGEPPARTIVAEQANRDGDEHKSARTADAKLIRRCGREPRDRFFDLRSDPGELRPLTDLDDAERLREAVTGLLERPPEAGAAPLPAAVTDGLRALGYLD